MAAHKVPIKLDQGATYDNFWVWKTGPKGAEVPVDLVGCEARAQIRPELESEDVLLELTTTNGRIALGGEPGMIRVVITDEDTAALTFDSAVYDLFIDFPNGTSIRRMSGSVSLTKAVTRD
jgi:hypothetical protein